MWGRLRANVMLVVLTLLAGAVVYPLLLLGIGIAVFPDQAEGSLERGSDGRVTGSRLIAQAFTADGYFWPRPSAVGYNAAAAGGSNWGASNPKLRFRVARQLGPIVRYADGRPVGPDIERWFAKIDRLAAWSAANRTLAAEWVKTDDTTKQLVMTWIDSHPDVLDLWRQDNVGRKEPNVAEGPDAVAVQFFASFAAAYPRAFPGLDANKRVIPRTSGTDLQGVFFDEWLREHPDANLQPVPADFVMASGSGLDPHISLRNARCQLDRVAAARGTARDQIEAHLVQSAAAPLGGLAGEPLVNVLDINRELDRLYPPRR